jgi:hypothetical protein
MERLWKGYGEEAMHQQNSTLDSDRVSFNVVILLFHLHQILTNTVHGDVHDIDQVTTKMLEMYQKKLMQARLSSYHHLRLASCFGT